MALSVLGELAPLYPHIRYYVVAAYLPKQNTPAENTILPEGIEFASPRAAIPQRNEWMIEHSDYVITYVRRVRGGAFRFMTLAEQMRKKVFKL